MDCVAMTDDELVGLAIEAMDGWAFWRDNAMNVVELTGADGAPFCGMTNGRLCWVERHAVHCIAP